MLNLRRFPSARSSSWLRSLLILSSPQFSISTNARWAVLSAPAPFAVQPLHIPTLQACSALWGGPGGSWTGMGAQGAGMWGHPEPRLTCVGWVAWLGSKAPGGEAKQIDSSVSLTAWPPARVLVWGTNRQAATPVPARAGSGRLQDRIGNRSRQTHLATMGAVPPACPPPGTLCRDGQLGTRQDISVKGGSQLTGIPHPPRFSITQPSAGWWAACQAGRK